jgi:hypothetical protein
MGLVGLKIIVGGGSSPLGARLKSKQLILSRRDMSKEDLEIMRKGDLKEMSKLYRKLIQRHGIDSARKIWIENCDALDRNL